VPKKRTISSRPRNRRGSGGIVVTASVVSDAIILSRATGSQASTQCRISATPSPFQSDGVRKLFAAGILQPGRLAQLVEHLLYTQGVGGSIPSPPIHRLAAMLARPETAIPSHFANLGGHRAASVRPCGA
jgi:hypothetical protein